MGWAALADTKPKDFRFSIGFATLGMAMGYFCLSLARDWLGQSYETPLIAAVIVLSVSLLICLFLIRDLKDKNLHTERSIKKEIHSILKDFIGSKRFRRAILAFMLWELSFYAIFILDVDMGLESFHYFSLSMLLWWAAGIGVLKLANASDKKMIKVGYIIALSMIALVFLLDSILQLPKFIALAILFISGSGCALLVPSLFSILSEERGAHEQGKIFGLIDSTDTISFSCAIVAGMLYIRT